MVLGSLDVTNLYGSLRTNPTCELVKKRVLKSNCKFEGIDLRWALIYLAWMLKPHQIVKYKLQQVIPKRLNKGKPTILTVEQDEKEKRWRYPTPPTKLDKDQITNVMSVVIAQMVRVTMTTNYYEW